MSIKFSFRLKKQKDAPPPVENGIFLKGNNGSAVVLIHGLTGTPNEMKFLAHFLNKKGYSVIVPRLANHGAPLDVLKYTKWEEFYQSARKAFIALDGQFNHIYVSGLSMGALLALLLAEEFPARITGVTCLSPTLFYDGWNTPWSKCLLPMAYRTPLKHFFYFKEDPPYGIKNEQIQQIVHRFYSRARLEDTSSVAQYGYPYFPVTLLYQLNRLVKHLSKRLHKINIPVQLIQAKEDDMTSVKNSAYIYDNVGSRKKEIVLLENSYHVITADQERDKVALKMDEFFSSLDGKASL